MRITFKKMYYLCSLNSLTNPMPLNINSYYKVTAKGKEPVIVKIVERPPAILSIKVEDIKTHEKKYLMSYLMDDTADLRRVSPSEIEELGE